MKRLIGLMTVLLVLSTGATAKNFTIEDSSSNPLLQVNGNTGEKQLKNGLVNISEGGEPIAEFRQSGITFDQPLSLESPGALSVQNGIDLTGTSSNTIDSYSTFYLTTSSGSPSDIVLQPTGEVGVDSNLSTTGNIDLQGNTLEGAGNLVDKNGVECGANEFLNGNGVCETDTDTDTDNQGLPNVLSQNNSAGSYNIDMNGKNVLNPNQVDGVDLDNPGNALTLSGSQYAVAGNSINDNEVADNSLTASSLSSGSITATGGELASGVAGNQLSLNSGALDVSEGSGSGLNADLLDGVEAVEFENETHGAEHAGSGLSNPSGDTLDVNAGNAITINSDNVAVASGSIDDNEISDNTVDDSEIQNSDRFTLNGVTLNGELRAQGNSLDLDANDQGVYIHDSTGNFNIKSGIADGNDTVVAGSGGSEIQMNENGRIELKIDESTAAGNTFGKEVGLTLDNGQVSLTGGFNGCNANEFVNGNGNCEIDTDTDTTKTEDEVEQDIFDTGDNDQGNLGLNGNEIVDTTGSVTLGGGNVDIPDGNLNISDNDIVGGHAIEATSGQNFFIQEADNSNIAVFRSGGNVEVPNGNLLATGSASAGETAFQIESSDGQSLSFVETTSGSQNNIALENPDGTQLLRWPDSIPRTWVTTDLEMRSDNMIRTGGGGGTQTGFYDSANSQNILVANEGGDVQIPSSGSALSLFGTGSINDAGTDLQISTEGDANQITLVDAANSQTLLRAQEGGNVTVPNGDLGVGTSASVGEVHISNSSSTTPGLFVQDPSASDQYGAKFVYNNNQDELALSVRSGGADTVGIGVDRDSANVRIPNGNLDMRDNQIQSASDVETNDIYDDDSNTVRVQDNIKTTTGRVGSDTRMCIGDRCA